MEEAEETAVINGEDTEGSSGHEGCGKFKCLDTCDGGAEASLLPSNPAPKAKLAIFLKL